MEKHQHNTIHLVVIIRIKRLRSFLGSERLLIPKECYLEVFSICEQLDLK